MSWWNQSLQVSKKTWLLTDRLGARQGLNLRVTVVVSTMRIPTIDRKFRRNNCRKVLVLLAVIVVSKPWGWIPCARGNLRTHATQTTAVTPPCNKSTATLLLTSLATNRRQQPLVIGNGSSESIPNKNIQSVQLVHHHVQWRPRSLERQAVLLSFLCRNPIS